MKAPLNLLADGVATALRAIANGIASAKDAALIIAIADTIDEFGDDLVPVKISKADIEKAVAATLPKILDDVVTAAVLKAVAEKEVVAQDDGK